MTDLMALVPARAGSKGVPNKNKIVIAGLPLIEHTVAALQASQAVSAIVVTSDDADILALYRDRPDIFTVERPAALAQDDSSTQEAVSHALDAWEKAGKDTPDAILLAQPTTPLRTARDIDEAYALFHWMGREPVISACRAEGIRHPSVMYRMTEDGRHGSLYENGADDLQRRQSFDIVMQRNGAIYLAATAFFRSTGRLRNATPVIYEMPWERSINIDGPGDVLIAKALIESGLIVPDPRMR